MSLIYLASIPRPRALVIGPRPQWEKKIMCDCYNRYTNRDGKMCPETMAVLREKKYFQFVAYYLDKVLGNAGFDSHRLWSEATEEFHKKEGPKK
jgi:hypothetical protein